MVGARRHPGPRAADGRLKRACRAAYQSRIWRSGRLGVLARLAKILDLTSGGRESVLHRDFGVLVALFIRRGVADHDIVAGRYRQQDVDLEVCSVPMMVARSDHGHPAGGDAIVIGCEPLEFTRDVRPNRIRWLASLEYDLKGLFHLGLSSTPISSVGNHQSTTRQMVAARMPIPEISVGPDYLAQSRCGQRRRKAERQRGLSSFRP